MSAILTLASIQASQLLKVRVKRAQGARPTRQSSREHVQGLTEKEVNIQLTTPIAEYFSDITG
jgi:hypothetical protein